MKEGRKETDGHQDRKLGSCGLGSQEKKFQHPGRSASWTERHGCYTELNKKVGLIQSVQIRGRIWSIVKEESLANVDRRSLSMGTIFRP